MTEDDPTGGAPALADPPTPDRENATPEAPIPFRQFLEAIHPSVEKNVSGLWHVRSGYSGAEQTRMSTPELRLHCELCDGKRTFRCDQTVLLGKVTATEFINYRCGDCQKHVKSFSLLVRVGETKGAGAAYKYGEKPSFGVPVPNKVLRLFGDDRENFLNGRQCENQGLGIGAFAYYRRVVENHKNGIFDEIIKVCKTVRAPQELVDELTSAKKETSFTKAIEQIKTALPQGLLINGHNPLLALHSALSMGLHAESDAKCLELAHDVRVVLTDLIDKMALLRRESSELHGAVQRLIAKKVDA
jgi:hypothetical protein